ncbi:NAD(P)H-dependent D-xylose reductase (XR) [Rhizophlyctis rosea]|uniref:NAD(P)H-dependent D-xylose reductase (XR) n=1 Tax=Rhizophlyctis rosea TaxID=64517 RepID=A0AAD5SIT4_9FUNG|nr:NAD(P)H-dependent D-xylose reductase (XR) [Rhizophlyctis rosea]
MDDPSRLALHNHYDPIIMNAVALALRKNLEWPVPIVAVLVSKMKHRREKDNIEWVTEDGEGRTVAVYYWLGECQYEKHPMTLRPVFPRNRPEPTPQARSPFPFPILNFPPLSPFKRSPKSSTVEDVPNAGLLLPRHGFLQISHPLHMDATRTYLYGFKGKDVGDVPGTVPQDIQAESLVAKLVLYVSVDSLRAVVVDGKEMHLRRRAVTEHFGTWGGGDDANQLSKAVREALEAGYRHIDCAEFYLNQKEIGQTLKKAFEDGVVKREELFITSKVWNTKHRPEHVRESCEKTLKDLQLDYLDLLLVHWPVAWKYTGPEFENGGGTPTDEHGRILNDSVPLQQTWQAFESLVDAGLVKHIGISNYPTILIADLLRYARIKPAVNQVELHPYLSQRKLVHYCQTNGIHVSAYTPLGRPGRVGTVTKEIIKEPVAVQIAEKLSKGKPDDQKVDVGHVLLRWHVERGVSVLPKSVTSSRIVRNLRVTSGIRLGEGELRDLDGLECGLRYNDMDLETGDIRPGRGGLYEGDV